MVRRGSTVRVRQRASQKSLQTAICAFRRLTGEPSKLLAGLVVAARSMRDMTDMSAAWIARAVEDNVAEFLLALGRAGGGRERDDAEITWVIGGSPIAYHNCVVRADLEPERADAAITESQ